MTTVLVQQSGRNLKKQAKLELLGTRHCFNKIAESTNHLLSLKPMDEVIALNTEAHTVTVDVGMTYRRLCPHLHSEVLRYTTWCRYHAFLSPGPAVPRHTARAKKTETSQPPYLLWKFSRLTVRPSDIPGRRTAKVFRRPCWAGRFRRDSRMSSTTLESAVQSLFPCTRCCQSNFQAILLNSCEPLPLSATTDE